MKNDLILEKRDDLERFIREQIHGPGTSGYRYIDIKNDILLKMDLRKHSPLEYQEEVLNIVPAGIYSTAILFPEKHEEVLVAVETESEEEPSTDKDNTGEQADASGTQENLTPDIEDEGAGRIDQLYPTTMGLTCCLNNDAIGDRNLAIKISVRHYKRVVHDKEVGRFGVLLQCDRKMFDNFLEYFQVDSPINSLVVQTIGENNILLAKVKLTTTLITAIRNSLFDYADALAVDLGYIGRRELSVKKISLFRELKNTCPDEAAKSTIYKKIERIETFDCIREHINDLLDLFTGGYGIWQSKLIEKVIDISQLIPPLLSRKVTLNYREHKELTDIVREELEAGSRASLSMNIQLTKDTRKEDNLFFLKAQLINTSTRFTQSEETSKYFSVFNETVNERCFFGVKLQVTSPSLLPYNGKIFDHELVSAESVTINEDIVTKYLYRQYRDYGTGHGCSVRWGKDSVGTMTVETEYIPTCDTPEVEPIPKDKYHLKESDGMLVPNSIMEDARVLEFKWLSTLSKTNDNEVREHLIKFVELYGDWINQKNDESKTDITYRSIVEQELRKCQIDKDRMIENIQEILANDENMKTFRLMNSAMFIQLWHSKSSSELIAAKMAEPTFGGFNQNFYENCEENIFGGTEKASWRAFQLAFILLNLDGIIQKKNDEKWHARNELVDLVWFPTGGGKTEAYLGIIALTLINRRKKYGPQGGGTAVIMRYTLRLLTLQQFQRATLLIMALELIRRWGTSNLGDEMFSIGLWVGDDSLPNSLDDLKEEFKKFRDGNSSKIPLNCCPWCNGKLNPRVDQEKNTSDVFNYKRYHLECSNPKCSFTNPLLKKSKKLTGPLPISLCDEIIYQHPPSLLFGTVDKFAQLAHKTSNEDGEQNKDSRRIFGRGKWEKGKPNDGYRTPDLIIQDELHLLLGPLGSSVALFESAVDQFCTRIESGVILRPKIISSTATTRNTDLQIMALFDRKVNLFPKPGVECDDSFFAFYKRIIKTAGNDSHKIQYVSKRRYMGFLPTGRTQIWMQMRLAAILMTHRAIFEKKQLKDDNVFKKEIYGQELSETMDNYHTIVSYFNSLREVGKTESQIDTYIIKELRRVFFRVMRTGQLMDPLYTFSIKKAELTGRLSGEDVKKQLDLISSQWESQNRFGHVIDGKASNGFIPPDFVVATNMISVGIDISRLNTLIVNSMPRNIAEYIQASSRVAREVCGLVLTLHHPFRARDVSHYEKFIEFHEKMYSYVEPISITPFTKKAIDRYLGLYMASMIRQLEKRFTNRGSADLILNISDEERGCLIESLTKYFRERYNHLHNLDIIDNSLKNLLTENDVQEINLWVTQAINDWMERKSKFGGGILVFSNKSTRSALPQEQLYVDIDEYEGNIHSDKWQIPQSLRVIEPEAVIKIKQK